MLSLGAAPTLSSGSCVCVCVCFSSILACLRFGVTAGAAGDVRTSKQTNLQCEEEC